MAAADIVIIIAACTRAHKKKPQAETALEETRMAERTQTEVYRRMFRLYPAEGGGWIYEVWIASRPVVIGWCHTQAAALQEASLA